jgi:DNA polymerase III subunit delta
LRAAFRLALRRRRVQYNCGQVKPRYDDFFAQLKQPLQPAYLISGDETLLVNEAADALRARAREAGFDEREVHVMDRGADWPSLRGSAGTLSLFGSRRVLEVRLPTGKPGSEGGAVLAELARAGLQDVLLLVLAPRLEREAQRAEWVRAIESAGVWLTVWEVRPEELVGWLRGRCRRAGLQAGEEALQLLAQRTEGNLLAAQQELDKLRLLATGDTLTTEDVLGSVGDSARFDVFQLQEALLTGDASRALRVLAGLRSEGVEVVLALWAALRALRDLGSVAVPGGGPQGWQHPRQAAALEQGRRRAARLPFTRLAVRAARTDRMIKGRLAGQPWDELALLAVEICGRAALPLPRAVLK